MTDEAAKNWLTLMGYNVFWSEMNQRYLVYRPKFYQTEQVFEGLTITNIVQNIMAYHDR